jgi:hypothetical protein
MPPLGAVFEAAVWIHNACNQVFWPHALYASQLVLMNGQVSLMNGSVAGARVSEVHVMLQCNLQVYLTADSTVAGV